jgi:hypothetical protein
VAYKVGPDDNVAAEVARFSAPALHYWQACLAEIAADPFPRIGRYVERVIPIRPFPMRTYLYEVTEETSISGERTFVFVAEFFPEYALVYVVDEAEREVVIIYLRPNRSL